MRSATELPNWVHFLLPLLLAKLLQLSVRCKWATMRTPLSRHLGFFNSPPQSAVAKTPKLIEIKVNSVISSNEWRCVPCNDMSPFFVFVFQEGPKQSGLVACSLLLFTLLFVMLLLVKWLLLVRRAMLEGSVPVATVQSCVSRVAVKTMASSSRTLKWSEQTKVAL